MSSLSGIKCWGEPLPPHEFLKKYGLPQVVRVHEGHKVQGPSRLALDRPLLLYKAYTCRKVHARSIDRDKTGEMTLVGPQLLLPDTYQGWFAVITDDGHTAGYFTNVAEVASAEVPYFLTRDRTIGYREGNDRQGTVKYSKVKIGAGEVLQFLGAYEDATPSLKSMKANTRYAKVVNRQGDLLYLPFTNSGKFFSVAGRRTRSVSHVYQVSQLLRVSSLPLTVRVMAGSGPRTRCPYTGLLRLEWVEERQVILACGTRSGRPALLEIDVDSAFSFLRPLDDHKVRLSKPFNRMLRFCREQGDTWVQQIKVAHHVVPTDLKHLSSFNDGGRGSSGDTYEDEDSAMKSSTVKSMSSSKSSASSKIFKRLRLLHQSWKERRHHSSIQSDDEKKLPGPSTSDFHLYERVRGNRRDSWERSSLSTEILDDDGYVTSDFGEDYDSVC